MAAFEPKPATAGASAERSAPDLVESSQDQLQLAHVPAARRPARHLDVDQHVPARRVAGGRAAGAQSGGAGPSSCVMYWRLQALALQGWGGVCLSFGIGQKRGKGEGGRRGRKERLREGDKWGNGREKREREREREEREREKRGTERQKDRKTERQKDTQTGRQTDSERARAAPLSPSEGCSHKRAREGSARRPEEACASLRVVGRPEECVASPRDDSESILHSDSIGRPSRPPAAPRESSTPCAARRARGVGRHR